MIRFPARTLVLMVLTLLAFAWFFFQMHRPHAPVRVQLLEADGGTP